MRQLTRLLLAALLSLALCVCALAAPEDGEAEAPANETPAEETEQSAAADERTILLGDTASAPAVDFDYTGELDAATGLPEGASVSAAVNRVSLSETMSYDRALGLFVYPLGTGLAEVRCTAADGMVCGEPVALYLDGDAEVGVYRDGVEVEQSEWESLHTPGEYAVYSGSGGGRVLSFTIVGPYTDRLYSYVMPDGFLVTAVTFNGEDFGADRYYVDMEQEGEYRVEYRCPRADLNLTLETTVDRTGFLPEIYGALGSDGRIHSSVDIGPLEPGASMYVEKDGELYTNFSYGRDGGTLTEPGEYSIVVADRAGNVMSYDFTIAVYFDLNSLIFFALIPAVCAAALGYGLFRRKRLKIR